VGDICKYRTAVGWEASFPGVLRVGSWVWDLRSGGGRFAENSSAVRATMKSERDDKYSLS
jgi:hypothetical protein